MPRKARVFTQEEIETVRELKIKGTPQAEIAAAVNLTISGLQWYLKTNTFGLLPKNQGRVWRPLKRPDDIETGMLFGCPETEWRERQQKIRDSWPPDVEHDRREGKLPNVQDNYAKFKRNNPNIKPKTEIQPKWKKFST